MKPPLDQAICASTSTQCSFPPGPKAAAELAARDAVRLPALAFNTDGGLGSTPIAHAHAAYLRAMILSRWLIIRGKIDDSIYLPRKRQHRMSSSMRSWLDRLPLALPVFLRSTRTQHDSQTGSGHFPPCACIWSRMCKVRQCPHLLRKHPSGDRRRCSSQSIPILITRSLLEIISGQSLRLCATRQRHDRCCR